MNNLCAHDTPRHLCDCTRWRDRYPALYTAIASLMGILAIQATVIGIMIAVTL